MKKLGLLLVVGLMFLLVACSNGDQKIKNLQTLIRRVKIQMKL